MTRALALASILCLSTLGCAKDTPMTGAYSSASVTNQSVQDAANFAVKAHIESLKKSTSAPAPSITLVKVLSAKQQVVAGMNYDLKLQLNVNGKIRVAQAVVYHQAWRTANPYELTSWEWK